LKNDFLPRRKDLQSFTQPVANKGPGGCSKFDESNLKFDESNLKFDESNFVKIIKLFDARLAMKTSAQSHHQNITY